MARTTARTASKDSAYVVVWTSYDPNEETADGGTLGRTTYPTIEAAHDAIMKDVLKTAVEDMKTFDAEDWMDTYGTKDPKEVAAQFVTRDTPSYVGCIVTSNSVELDYSVCEIELPTAPKAGAKGAKAKGMGRRKAA